jgi:hypothetical protein
MQDKTSHMDAADIVRLLMEKHRIGRTLPGSSLIANNIDRLSEEAFSLDDIEMGIIALQRGGHISGDEAGRLHGDYLRQRRNRGPSQI